MSKNTSGMDSSKKASAFSDFPLADSDQCVKCGLCLPHCPTYKLSLHEGDSPRGRIALMQGLAQQLVDTESTAAAHLDGCLVCRACEPVCPAKVPYGRLIDAGRKGLWRSGHRPGAAWHLLQFFRLSPTRINVLVRLLYIARRSGLASLAKALPSPLFRRAGHYLASAGAPPRPGKRNEQPDSARVNLFLGCVARSLDHSVLHATVRVLNAINIGVNVSRAQGCCGAMDAHAGDAETAVRLAERNIAAFDNNCPVISTASGCGLQLKEYDEWAGEAGRSTGNRVHDVMHFIHQRQAQLPDLRHAYANVVVHSPCTLKNAMREAGTFDVLQRIAGLEIRTLQHRDCCGAAGSYLFEHAATADALGERLLDALGNDIPDIFVTSNTGCAIHLRRLAKERNLSMQVLHPIEVLAASLPASSAA